MRPFADFLFKVLGKRLDMTEDQYQNVMEAANDPNQSIPFLDKISKYWWLPFLLGLLAPLVSKWLDKFFDDEDGDGDVDPVDALLAIAEKLRGKDASR